MPAAKVAAAVLKALKRDESKDMIVVQFTTRQPEPVTLGAHQPEGTPPTGRGE